MQPGERIKQFRKNKRLTQKDIEEKTGFSQGFISEIERGLKEPSREFLKKLNEVYNISSDYVLYGFKQNISPHIIGNVPLEYGIAGSINERRLPQNDSKRKLVNKVVKILNSGNKKVIKALKSNIDVFLAAVETTLE